MTTLRQHLTIKLADPDFRAGYGSWCEACPRTMEIVGRIQAAGVTVEALARQVDVEPELVQAFIDAERCEHDVMTKLCAHFGVAPPQDCKKMHPR
jgi:hypothetical protein